MRITYVILHYEAIEQTINCVKSVKAVMHDEDKIIIVDNASPNGSGVELKRMYSTDNSIDCILSEKNLGFACGHNLGYSVAKKQYQSDFIILLNNDTLINQSDFRIKLLEEYNKDSFGIGGPKLLNKEGHNSYSNPVYFRYKTANRILVAQILNIVKYYGSYIGLDLLMAKILDSSSNENNKSHLEKENIRQDNIKIQGSCFIFAKSAIDKMDGLNPNTFMYCEEDILIDYALKNNIKVSYLPCLEIVHLGGVSTSVSNADNSGKKRRFRYKCMRDSLKVMKKQICNK